MTCEAASILIHERYVPFSVASDRQRPEIPCRLRPAAVGLASFGTRFESSIFPVSGGVVGNIPELAEGFKRYRASTRSAQPDSLSESLKEIRGSTER